ncbi:SDR family oxidoreductase [Streptomyces rubellomurinus]|uniref:Short-chain dehydrogenase n=1 Tax=Streptomyces rubellomurinus (strain ATCC 31215) TaxID=359131 RepID=A0A0F2T9H5_STRR3|nr:SDR family oxidoreductase [Streptomyces rubellomurinus]KJS59868.1 short-chain dehydrogenase [Streptomyces rubellomurinus]
MGEPDGRTALVTGGSRGIGRAVAQRLAADGALVAVHYGGNEEAAEETVKSIAEAGGRAFAVRARFGERGALDELFDGLAAGLAEHGEDGLDVLVNNAGIHLVGSIGNLTEEEFDRAVTINVRTPVFVIQRALPLLRDGGRIVNVASAATRIGSPLQIGYTLSKAALTALAAPLANELGRRGITVNTVNPGVVLTDMTAGWTSAPEAMAELESITALGRIGRPEDIADVVGFLASPQGGWVTGQTVDASGGTYLGPIPPA